MFKPYFGLVDTLTKEQPKPQSSLLSREPSFLYDTTVEAFNTQGTDVDENEELNEESISIIGQIADLVDEKDEVTKFIQDNTPSQESKVEKFQVQGFEESVSMSDSQLENVEDVEKEQDRAIEIPKGSVHRRLSTVSVEEGNRISSSFDGEKYFMKREESFITKVHKGEVENLAVEVSDFFSLEHSASHSSLSVKPFDFRPESEIVVENLGGSQSNLIVKPLETTIKSIPCSSFEHLYDRVEADDDVQMSAADILSIGDKFEGTHEYPEFYSSFEELYKKSSEERENECKQDEDDKKSRQK